jgi:peptide/nickel transport system permease protein/nickel transport system permease protein
MQKIIDFIKQNKQFSFFTLLAGIIVAVAVLAPLLPLQDPTSGVISEALKPPSAEHWFGTDKLGRDLFSRVIYGARISLSSALVLVAAIFVIGTIMGVVAGYFGGWVDAVIMRIADIMISFPGMVLAIAIAGIMGASIVNAIIAITVVSWTKYARLARSLVLKIRHRDYVYAATVTGSKTLYILRKYMLPNALPTLIITAATDIGSMMLELAGLSFLGFGAKAPTPEWGFMLNEGRTVMESAPWLMLFPGCAILLVVVVFNLLGDSLRDVLDPRSE